MISPLSADAQKLDAIRRANEARARGDERSAQAWEERVRRWERLARVEALLGETRVRQDLRRFRVVGESSATRAVESRSM